MRVVLELFREADGRLEGVLELPDGHRDGFTSTLDLLRVLESLELSHRPGVVTGAGAGTVCERGPEVDDD